MLDLHGLQSGGAVNKMSNKTANNGHRGTDRIPISVLTGFLGAGKTTVLNHLMSQPELSRTLVIINEFGEIGLDHDLVTHVNNDVVVEMSSGCLCCTIRGDLAKTLREAPWRFARGGETWFDRVMIETTGLADPAPILHTLMNEKVVAKSYHLDGVITVVDAAHGGDTLRRQTEAVKQVAVADRLLLTKTDLIDQATLDDLQKRLRALNPAAPQVKARHGVVDPMALLEAGVYDPKTKTMDVQNWLNAEAYGGSHNDHHDHHHHTHDHDHDHSDINRHDENINAVCLTIEEPVHEAALELWFNELLRLTGADLLRMKGIINVIGTAGPTVVHAVQHIIHPTIHLKEWPSQDRHSKIVFITRNIEDAALKETLKVLKGRPVQSLDALPLGHRQTRNTDDLSN